MKKQIIALVCLVFLCAALFGSCTSKTPDVVASEEANVTLEDVNWSIPIVIESTGETVTYTMEQAEAHDLAKTYISAYQFDNSGVSGNAPQVMTFILEGVRFSDVLADLGLSDCNGISVEHNNVDTVYEYDKEVAMADGSVIGWIQNKTLIVQDSAPSYCAFGSSEAGVREFCHSIKQITIH